MIKDYFGSLYGSYRTNTFTDIFPSLDDFLSDLKASAIPNLLKDDSLSTVYYLLYANYGNSHIASSDETRFKYQVFTTIFKYGPTWEKELEIQARLRSLTEEELMEGSKSILNVAANPSIEPTTDTMDELQFINSQNVAKKKKDYLTAYSQLDILLKTDVTTTFISKFNNLFLKIVQPEAPLLYEEVDQ